MSTIRTATKFVAALVTAVLAIGVSPAHAAGAHHGHTIVTDVHHVVTFSNLPSCEYEDGGENQPCSWNLHKHDGRGPGKGKGLSYWIDREDATHYVWPSRKVALHGGFHFVTKRQAHDLSSTGEQTPRYWRGCVVRFGDRFTTVRCADGYSYTDRT